VEYNGGTKSVAFQTIAEKIESNTKKVLKEAKKSSLPPRKAAVSLAVQKVKEAMTYRRWSLF